MRTGENIHKRSDGRWEARYYDKVNKKYISLYGKTYNDAKKKLLDYTPKSQKRQKKNAYTLTLKDALTLHLEEIRPNIKLSTYSTYKYLIDKYYTKIGRLKLSELQQAHVSDFQSELLATLSAKTVKDISSLLKQCLKKYEILFDFKIYTHSKKEIRTLPNDDYIKLLHYLLFATDSHKVGTLLALMCGMRIGEICALQWQDINIKQGIINVTKTVQRIKNTSNQGNSKTIVIIDTPKTQNSIRKIPIPTCLDFICNLEGGPDTYILTNNTHFMEPRTMQNIFKKQLAECNIENINFHALRHTFATKCSESKIDIKCLSELLGHSCTSFTLDTYVHPSIESKIIELQKLTQNINGQIYGQKNS